MNNYTNLSYPAAAAAISSCSRHSRHVIIIVIDNVLNERSLLFLEIAILIIIWSPERCVGH